jgi:hypothetical protein
MHEITQPRLADGETSDEVSENRNPEHDIDPFDDFPTGRNDVATMNRMVSRSNPSRA